LQKQFENSPPSFITYHHIKNDSGNIEGINGKLYYLRLLPTAVKSAFFLL
jgi:hypothetical protein